MDTWLGLRIEWRLDLVISSMPGTESSSSELILASSRADIENSRTGGAHPTAATCRRLGWMTLGEDDEMLSGSGWLGWEAAAHKYNAARDLRKVPQRERPRLFRSVGAPGSAVHSSFSICRKKLMAVCVTHLFLLSEIGKENKCCARGAHTWQMPRWLCKFFSRFPTSYTYFFWSVRGPRALWLFLGRTYGEVVVSIYSACFVRVENAFGVASLDLCFLRALLINYCNSTGALWSNARAQNKNFSWSYKIRLVYINFKAEPVIISASSHLS